MSKQRTATWNGGMACRGSDGRIELLAIIDDGPDTGRVVRVRLTQDDGIYVARKLIRWTHRPVDIETSTASVDDYEAR